MSAAPACQPRPPSPDSLTGTMSKKKGRRRFESKAEREARLSDERPPPPEVAPLVPRERLVRRPAPARGKPGEG